jgi:uncharacterized membrane-anchored protein
VQVVGWGLLTVIAAMVIAPLAREYLDFRHAWGLGRMGALGITALVLPSFAVGFGLALPLHDHPGIQWVAAVLATLVVYSLAVRRIEEVVEASPARAQERPR